ncbi:MAG: RdgB/HAM1 family non-canonical purine NTP pyrophosphatase [Bernardetiaceae bacterium]|nr:RdgB/HAM1 family non-canonical purine NTP pyrophosphatase [Bernardetiaceae bacterium]
MKLCLASNNPNKIKEIRAVVPPTIALVSLQDIGCDVDLPETRGTIEGNSEEKAAYVFEHYGINCLSDDTGLEVFALGDAPGVDSAFYSGSRDSLANIQKLLAELGPDLLREAQFRTVMTLFWEGKAHQFEGIAKGRILEESRGTDGFGYDPIFLPEGEVLTFAEMSLAEKNKFSHRAKALRKVADFLAQL